MATVFMKWLETSPKDYERGIRLITLGQIKRLRRSIVADNIHPGLKVLDLGCGTGELTAMMAAEGALVTAVDASPAMIAEAEKKIKQQNLYEHVELFQLDAALIDEVVPQHSFDLVVCSMLFSDVGAEMQGFLLHTLPKLLKQNGKILILDEAPPKGLIQGPLYRLLRMMIMIVTWLLTRNFFSQPLTRFQEMFDLAGYQTNLNTRTLLGSLVIFEAKPEAAPLHPHIPVRRLSHRTTIKSLAKDLLALFFRMFPPYPKTRPGLYAVGAPDQDAPVLVTGNFDLTIRRLVKAIDGLVNCWVLVVDSGGINVWCAAGGGFLTAEKVIGALKTSGLSQMVGHKSLVLPQLAACGVDGWKIREATGWSVAWGPVRADEIPAYLASGQNKTEEMRLVRFPLLNRLEMLCTVLSFYALLILLPVFLFLRDSFWQVTLALICIAVFYAITLPVLPGKDGLVKSLPLAMIVLAGYFIYNQLNPGMAAVSQFRWGIGLVGLSVFTAGELQGTSPLMRGEQANWIPEGIIGVVLLGVYFLVPMLLGWS